MTQGIDYTGGADDGRNRALADLVLPGFIEPGPEGVFVDREKLSSCQEMTRLVDRIFTCNGYFEGLDYGALIHFLYHFDPVGASGRQRLASRIREMPAARRALYRAVKVSNGEVEYIFEPVFLETTVEEPLLAEDENGEPEIIGMQTRVVQEPAKLDFDEFVADLWQKGIRYGLDEKAVRGALEGGKMERVVIARPLAAKNGVDAGIEEQTPELHRDNAPRLLSGGRVDLRQFKNRFPQMQAGAVLLKKLPRQAGQPGFSVQGVAVMPPLPKDFELSHLAGPGTRVEKREDGEYILASMSGFLMLDARSNQLSISEKIVNRDGVSVRTTGDLALAGEEYEEFGEVQERRVVEGRGITLHADVFGRIISHGGLVHLDHNLVGGSAYNQAGDIQVAGLASGALLESPQGEIRVKRAENSILRGRRVVLEWAANCTILADEVEIMVAEGSAIAGQQVRLRESRARNQAETVVSMLLPDLSGFDRQGVELERKVEEARLALHWLERDQGVLLQHPEVQRYLTLAPKIQKQQVSLSAEQLASWQRLHQQVAPDLQKLARLHQGEAQLRTTLGTLEQALVDLLQAREVACAGRVCEILAVAGDLRVQSLVLAADDPVLVGPLGKALAARLRGAGGERLFAGNKGNFSWTWTAPAASPDPA